MTWRSILISGVAASLLAGILPSAQAQETNRARSAEPAAPGPRPGPGLVADGMAPVLNVLTEEQRASFRQTMQAQREKVRTLESGIAEARRELVAGLGGKFDEEAVRKRAQAIANLEAELTVLRFEALSRVRPPLSAEQIERIRNAPERPRPGARPPLAPGRRRILSSPNRDENDLPAKQ